MELELRHLRIICTIAETGSLTRAATSLRLTQPGLSAQLKRIESLLGGSLFDRTPSGVVPTAFGDVVLTRALAVLPTVDELLGASALASQSGVRPSRLRLGSTNAPLLSGLIAAVRQHHPGREVTSRAHPCPIPLVEDVAHGRLDAAVVGESPGYELIPGPSVVLQPIVTEPIFIALPATHPLAAAEEVTLDDLVDEDWAAPPPDADRTREYWSTTLIPMGYRMRTVHEVEGRVLVDLIRSGHTVSFCQATFEELPGIAVRPIVGNPLWYRFMIAWHRDGPLGPISKDLVRHTTEAYQTAASRSRVYQDWMARQATEPTAPAAGGRVRQ